MPRRRGSSSAAAHAAGLRVLASAPQLPLGSDRAENQAPAPAGKGRPPGAINKTSSRLAAYLVARGFPLPELGLAECYSRPTHELARFLECSPLEAYQLQLKAMAELLPYTARKLPIEIAGSVDVNDTRSDQAIAEGIVAKIRAMRDGQKPAIEGEVVKDEKSKA